MSAAIVPNNQFENCVPTTSQFNPDSSAEPPSASAVSRNRISAGPEQERKNQSIQDAANETEERYERLMNGYTPIQHF